MKFHQQKLRGVVLIEPEPYTDERGLFRRQFCQREFSEAGLMADIKQCNVSENKSRNTLRGFHYQLPPHAESKVLSCMKGAVHDIVIDLRKGSETWLKWQSFKLTEENRLSLYVPAGCANAYLTLRDDTWIFYYHSEFYAPGAEGGIRYDDPLFNFDWPARPEVISDKDRNIPIVDPKTFLAHSDL